MRVPPSSTLFPTRRSSDLFGGCLPTLIQFPFLLAFYSMLSTVNELRNANWMWVHDLSAPDPWKLLPVRSEEHTSELQSLRHLVCRLLLENKNSEISRSRII